MIHNVAFFRYFSAPDGEYIGGVTLDSFKGSFKYTDRDLHSHVLDRAEQFYGGAEIKRAGEPELFGEGHRKFRLSFMDDTPAGFCILTLATRRKGGHQ